MKSTNNSTVSCFRREDSIEFVIKTTIFFPENMIDEEALRLLDHDSIKEMITAVGPRRKLLKKLEEEKVL